MAVLKNKSTEENRDFWSHVEAVAKEVSTWPEWMGNRRVKEDDDQKPASSRSARVTESKFPSK